MQHFRKFSFMNDRLHIKKCLPVFLIFLLLVGCAHAKNRRQNFLNNHPEISKDHKEAISNGEVRLGMNKKEVLASLGTPWEKVISDSALLDKIETWSYGECLYRCDEIIFNKDGEVIDYDTYKDEE